MYLFIMTSHDTPLKRERTRARLTALSPSTVDREAIFEKLRPSTSLAGDSRDPSPSGVAPAAGGWGIPGACT
jgi:hypothetical protein